MTPSKQFPKFLAKNGLKHRKFHSLRHTSATLLLYAGVNIKQVQGRLGHGDIETTNKYLHLIEEADVEAANKLDIMLLPKSDSTNRKWRTNSAQNPKIGQKFRAARNAFERLYKTFCVCETLTKKIFSFHLRDISRLPRLKVRY